MPCGCEGHFDNLELCRFPTLKARVAAVDDHINARTSNSPDTAWWEELYSLLEAADAIKETP